MLISFDAAQPLSDKGKRAPKEKRCLWGEGFDSLLSPLYLQMKQDTRTHKTPIRMGDNRWNYRRLNPEWRDMANLINRKFNLCTPYEPGREYLFDVLPDNSWEGQRCFIIGGGPSLKDFDFEQLREERVIAINRAYERAPFADIMFSIDPVFYRQNMAGEIGKDMAERKTVVDKWNSFTGRKVWLDTNTYNHKGIYLLYHAGAYADNEKQKTKMIDGIITGNFAGYAAINLAFCLGADPVYLLGYDCKWNGGKTHFHSGYESTADEMKLKKLAMDMTRLKEKAQRIGVNIVNLNLESAIKCFPIDTIESVLQKPYKAKIKARGYMVVSFYTTGTGYESEIEKLKHSLRQFNLPFHIFTCEPQGSWRANLNYKSACILKAFDMFPDQDIVFIDSDAIVRQQPVIFDELSAHGSHDMAAHFHDYKQYSAPGGSLLSGTLWFRNNETSQKIVKLWHEIALQYPQVRHQHCLRLAIEETRKKGGKINKFRLPKEYTCIFDYRENRNTKPVIEHFQASRKLRAQVGKGGHLVDSNFLSLRGRV